MSKEMSAKFSYQANKKEQQENYKYLPISKSMNYKSLTF